MARHESLLTLWSVKCAVSTFGVVLSLDILSVWDAYDVTEELVKSGKAAEVMKRADLR